MEDSVKLQSEDCLDVDSELQNLHLNCRGKSECKSYWVQPIEKEWTGECKEKLNRKNELTVQYRCGKNWKYFKRKKVTYFLFLVECIYWVDYVQGPNCLDTALIKNSWIEEKDLTDMQEADKKNLLISKLNKNLNSEIHTLSDLSMRPVSVPEGGLCGIAAMYQGLSSSVLTKSQLKKHDYGSMKKYLLAMMDHFSTYVFNQYHKWKKKVKSDDRLLIHKLYVGKYVFYFE